MSSLHLKNNGNQNRYTRRQEQRRKIDSLISSEGLELGRREPTAEEVQQMQNGIDENKISEFGLLRLSSLNLNICYDISGDDGLCSLLHYAVSHGRDKIAMALIRAGAQPHPQCISEPAQIFRTFRELNPQYAVWLMVFEQARRKPATTCEICCANQVDCVQFDTCCHKVCLNCFWVRVSDLDGLKNQLPDMLSNLTIWDKILDPMVCCLSCGNQAYIGETGHNRKSKLLLLPSVECNRESYDLFRTLPVSHLSASGKVSDTAGQHKGKKDKSPKSMHLCELAQCSLATTQAQRQEEFVKACMKADLRRVAALIEAGVHLDGVDEYGMTALMQAAWLGHVHVCALLLAAGADVCIQDALDHTALSIAVSTCDDEVIQLLLRVQDAAGEHDAKVLRQSTEDVDVSYSNQRSLLWTAETKCLPLSLSAIYQEHYGLAVEPPNDQNSPQQSGVNENAPILSILIPPEASQVYHENGRTFWREHGVKGAEPGAFCLDHFFADVFLHRLMNVFTRLPVAPSEKLHCASRSYFCDVEERFTKQLEQAIDVAIKIGSLRKSTNSSEYDYSDSVGSAARTVKVFPQVRFLHYKAEGTALAPHVDLARHDPRDVHLKSTHTFILYLTDCDTGGGETVLLKSLCAKGKAVSAVTTNNGPSITNDDNTIAAVSPRRGRLLLFPHNCPHEGRAISSKDPKLLLRGEVYIEFC